MNLEKLEKLNQLAKIIKETKKGLDGVYAIEARIKSGRKDNSYDDGLYSLYIGVHSDFSGASSNLVRYSGNAEVVKVIKETLERQLADYEKEFEGM